MKVRGVNLVTLCLGFGLLASLTVCQAEKPAAGALVRGTDMLGAKLFNESGKHIGELKDVIFDENKGAIAYGVLAVGDWLGLKDRLAIVPWKFLKPAKANSPEFVVGADKAKLKDSPHAVAGQTWPVLNDDWNRMSAAYYGIQPGQSKGQKLVRASEVITAKLWNQTADEIGNIQDLLVDPGAGRVAYGILEIGAWATAGNKLVAIPWSLVRQSKKASPGYVLGVERSKLNPRSFFTDQHWPSYNDPAWSAGMQTLYGASTR